MSHRLSRRRFMRNAASVSGALILGPYILSAAQPSKKIAFAHIGTGGRGGSHLGLSNSNVCIAFCDVDKTRWPRGQAFANATGYQDYRKLFDKHAKEIDAVVVATPDHHHYPASMTAIMLGKHVYCEKPLTWCVNEAKALAEAAVKYKVATQMGNDRHANEGNRLVVEYVKSGVLGDIKEIHTWTNRPIWPQGLDRPSFQDPVPDTLDWDCWIGPAPMRPYAAKWPDGRAKGRDVYAPFSWRGWIEFGCGAIGDMGCHTWDSPFWSMMPDYPSAVELLKIEGTSQEQFPARAQFRWDFPEKNGRPAFAAFWYDGGLKPAVPEEMLNDPVRKSSGRAIQLPGSGSLFIGSKGKMLVSGDYSDSCRLIPESFHKEMPRPPKVLERSPGHKEEWLMAIRGEKPLDFPKTNFPGYASPLTEVMLLGAMLEHIAQVGFKIECDPVARTIKTKEAIALASREYRAGWKV